MKGLRDTLANLAALRGKFEKLLSSASARKAPNAPLVPERLRHIQGFGSNPGNLRMLSYVPSSLPKSPALVVALHGCTQTAAGYDHGSGWSSLAEAHGFALLFPEQQRSNNPNNCFNWFLPSETRRDQGEALSIHGMIERMARDHDVDRRRIFIVGLSAGGAMAAAMLAAYPEVFAGGGIIAGLPHGSAANVKEAFEAMARGKDHSAEQWGDLVRSSSPHKGPWPRLSIWHGSADTLVNPVNMEAALRQWTDVHGLSFVPRLQHKVHGHDRRVWRSDDDVDLIEAITIAGMPHGVPIASSGPEHCGNVSPFHFDVGLSSGHHMIRFWGLVDDAAFHAKPAEQARADFAPTDIAAPAMAARGAISDADGTRNDHEPDRHADPLSGLRDPRGIIAAALKAAGLLGEAPGARGNALDPRRIVTSTLRSVGLLKDER
jgi:poly(hydroxyalkanoate) depolymerase family esterase